MINKPICCIAVLVISLVISGCKKKNDLSNLDDVVAYFNSKGRWERFQNSTLIYGEKITKEAHNLLSFDTSMVGKIYRKAAHVFDNDSTTIYFMYGLASSDSILSELRVRSFKDNEMVTDTLLLQYAEDNQLYHDYWFDENRLTLYTSKTEKLTHYSFFLFENGEVIDNTMIPDSVFGVHRLLPEMGRRVQLIDGYYNNQLRENRKKEIAKGTIINFFGGGKSCPTYMMIDLDVPYENFQLVQVSFLINAYTSVYGLANDSLELLQTKCFEPSYWPSNKPVFLEESIYIEYQ